MNSNIYDPFEAVEKSFPLAKRPESLRGRVVGLYDNTKDRADIILGALGQELVDKHGVKRLVRRRGVHFSKPASEEIMNEIARDCDAVICGLGA